MSRKALKPEERQFTLGDREFRLFSELARQQTGIVLTDKKRDMVYSRLVRRLRALRLDSFADYCDLIETEGGREEITNFVNAITTNLTHFFREPHHFDHLRDKVLRPLADHPADRHVRLWSAACSAGMEPFSIAMVLDEIIPDRRGWDARILATDIDTNMLDQGRTADYPIEQYDNIPSQYRRHVKVDANGERFRVGDALRSLITFKQLNLLADWPMRGRFDAIFCRNVVIYFDKPTQARLFDKLADYLKPGGFLYIGHSENLLGCSGRLRLAGRTIYQLI